METLQYCMHAFFLFRMAKRKAAMPDMVDLSQIEFESESDSSDDPYCDSDDDEDFVPTESEDSEAGTDDSSDESESETDEGDHNKAEVGGADILPDGWNEWFDCDENFQPRVPPSKEAFPAPKVHASLSSRSSVLEIFLKLCPLSLFIWISQCTNMRLAKLKKKVKPTTCWEVMVIIGCTFVMAYNRLPSFAAYWSKHESLGNKFIRNAISREGKGHFCPSSLS